MGATHLWTAPITEADIVSPRRSHRGTRS